MKKAAFLIVFIITGLVLQLSAQLDRSKVPQPGPAPKVVVGAYQNFELPNGLKVVVIENHRIPKVNYTMVLDYDPIMEGEFKGFVDISGGLIGTGTTTRTKDQINDEIDFIGAELRFSATGLQASCLKKHNARLLEIMSDALVNAVFKQEELDKLKKQSLSGLAAAKKDPEEISDRITKALMFGKTHPYGNSPSEKSLGNVTVEMCSEFYKNYVRPNICYLAIVGDINLQEAKDLTNKYFAGWQKSEVPKYSFPVPKAPVETRVAIFDRPASVQSLIKVCYPVPLKVGDEDYIKAKVTNTILGGGTFRLFKNLRETHGFTYGSYSQLNQDKYIGNFMANAEVRNSATDSAVGEIMKEMRRMREEKVPESELSMVKNYAAGTFALSLENPQTVANFALNTERFGLPKDYYQNYMQRILAVNADDVMQAAKKYIQPDNAYIMVVGKAENVAGSLKQFSKSQPVYYDFDGNVYDPSKKLKAAPAGLTAQAVVEKYIEAIGGRKVLSKIEDISITMSTSMQGMTINIKSVQKLPNKMLVEVSSGGQVFSKQIYDGQKGVMASPMGNQEMDAKALEDMKYQSAMNIEMEYEKYGIKTSLLGIEQINGKDAYQVELLYPGGKKETESYDAATGLKLAKNGPDGKSEFSDYREVNGIKFPFIIQQEMEGQMMKMTVEKVEVNTKPDDSIFKI